ncbi:MAG TPA: aldo/keto reductase [Pirellulaceae bacterium]|nr:aldo/keto reductase [Pirellulaceae bacterium]
MNLRPLGSTGLRVSPLGFGAFKIGRNQKIKYAQAYDLPDEPTVHRLLDRVLDLGINYFDTAPAYGLSEERIGRWLPARRQQVVLSTKVGETFLNGESHYDFSATAVRASVQRSLRLLQTDVIDIVFIHTSADDVRILNETPVVSVLQELKAAGQIRAIGLSGKTPAAAELALAWADLLMIEFHLSDTSHAAVLQAAAQRNIGVVVKKGLASGQLAPEIAIPFVLSQPGVSSLVVGGLNLEHMASNLRFAA